MSIYNSSGTTDLIGPYTHGDGGPSPPPRPPATRDMTQLMHSAGTGPKKVAASGLSAVVGMAMDVGASVGSTVMGMEMEVAASGVSAVMGMVMEVAASGVSAVMGMVMEVAASGLFKHLGKFDL